MNYPIWEVPSGGMLIATVAILHVFVSHFAVGGGLFLVLAERRARQQGDQAFLGYLRGLSRAFVLLTLVFGALSGVGIWFTISLVSPQGTSALINGFVWAWAIEWTFFLTEIAAALVYYYGWDRLDARTHLTVGWIYFAAAWLSLVVINGILTFMLTSGSWPATRGFWDGLLNPGYLPALVLRTLVAVGLAGLFALYAAASLEDGALKARVARYAASRWILPAAVGAPLALLWTLSVLGRHGVPVSEILGAHTAGIGALLQGVFAGPTAGGVKLARHAARATLLASVLLALGALVLATIRSRRYGRAEAGVLMLLGLLAMGGGEWVREDLRKPWLIDHVMFVNGVRLPALAAAPVPPEGLADPFNLAALNETGVLAATPWQRLPPAYRPGDPAFESLPPTERASLAAEAGRELFRIECSACHSVSGHMAVQKLVRGKPLPAIEKVLANLARPVDAEKKPASWSDPNLRLETWLGRRMPPFAGTDAEKRSLAIYLARLGGAADAGVAEAATAGLGARTFSDHCEACHGANAQWPLAPRLKQRTADQLYELLGHLDTVNPDMPAFEGSDAERRALAEYLAAQGGQR